MFSEAAAATDCASASVPAGIRSERVGRHRKPTVELMAGLRHGSRRRCVISTAKCASSALMAPPLAAGSQSWTRVKIYRVPCRRRSHLHVDPMMTLEGVQTTHTTRVEGIWHRPRLELSLHVCAGVCLCWCLRGRPLNGDKSPWGACWGDCIVDLDARH